MKTYCFLLEKEVSTECCTVCGKEKLCDTIHELIRNELELSEQNEELRKEIAELNKAYEGFDF